MVVICLFVIQYEELYFLDCGNNISCSNFVGLLKMINYFLNICVGDDKMLVFSRSRQPFISPTQQLRFTPWNAFTRRSYLRAIKPPAWHCASLCKKDPAPPAPYLASVAWIMILSQRAILHSISCSEDHDSCDWIQRKKRKLLGRWIQLQL